MITFGIEAIANFPNFRKAFPIPPTADLFLTFDEVKNLTRQLRKAGHVREFYKFDDKCFEIHLRDPSLKGVYKETGIDDQWADDVDLFVINTHGNRKEDKPLVMFDTNKSDWLGLGKFWKLGNKKLKWLMIMSCQGINKDNVNACIDIFDNLHGICGAYGLTYGRIDLGEDLGEYLTDGDYTVANAWLEAQDGDWWHDNHPIVVCANDKLSYDNKGNLIKFLSTLNLDFLTPQGFTVRGIPRSNIVGLHYMWIE